MLGLPSPPEGYMYEIDKYGNQTTVLQKIFTEAYGIIPAEITGNISSAVSNINMAQSALSSFSTANLSSFITDTIGSTSGLLSTAQNMLDQLPMIGDIKNIASKLLSTNALLDNALTKLDSLKGFVSGQLSGFIESCKWATTLAKGFITDAWESLNKTLSGVSNTVEEFVSDAASKLEEAVSNLGPSFAETVAAVKDGSIFTEIKSKLGDMVTAASILPASLSNSLNAALGGTIGSLGGTITNGIVEMSADAISDLKSIAQTSGSSAITDAISNAPKILGNTLSSLTSSISDTAKSFGVPVDEMGSAMDEFTNELESLTGIDKEQFLANPLNAAKQAATQALTEAVTAIEDGLNEAIIKPATDAISSSIADIKAKAFAMQLATINITPISEAVAKTVNPAMYDKLNITVAINEESKKSGAEVKKEPILAGLPTPQDYKPSTPTSNGSNDKVYKQEVTDFLAMVNSLNDEVTSLRIKAENETGELMKDIELRREVIRRAETEGGYNLEKLQKYKEETQLRIAELNSNPTYKQFRTKYLEFITMNDAYERYVVGGYTSGSPRSSIPEEIRAKMSMETTYKSAN